jgi:hypothetical protein
LSANSLKSLRSDIRSDLCYLWELRQAPRVGNSMSAMAINEMAAPSTITRLFTSGGSSQCKIASRGIDLGKTTFHLVALGERNRVLIRKKFSRAQLLAYTAKIASAMIGIEACAGSHFMGGKL